MELVHFVLARGYAKGEHRPAIVLDVYDDHSADLIIFLKPSDFSQAEHPGVVNYVARCPFSEEPREGAWHPTHVEDGPPLKPSAPPTSSTGPASPSTAQAELPPAPTTEGTNAASQG